MSISACCAAPSIGVLVTAPDRSPIEMGNDIPVSKYAPTAINVPRNRTVKESRFNFSPPSLFQGREETRTDLQAQGIDKEYESEILGKQQHLRVDFESEMPCDNTGEKDESHTKRYALEFYFVAGQAHRADE